VPTWGAVNLGESSAQRLLQGIGRLLLPPRCLLCGSATKGELDLCPDCASALPWSGSACARCALPLPDASTLCGRCLKQPPAFDAVWASFAYAGAVERLLPRLKFHADLAAGSVLSSLMCQRVPAIEADAVVAVPLHRARLAERGYNQALELARPLATRLGAPLQVTLLTRARATTAQTGLSGAERRRNLREAFAVRGAAPARVLLIDDVMTTGTTLAACAAALKQAGAGWVGCWVAARVAERN